MKHALKTLILTFALASSAWSSGYELVWERPVSGSGYSYLSPILGASGELLGYVGLEPDNGRVAICLLDRDSLVFVSDPRTLETCASVTVDDTLESIHIYTLSYSYSDDPVLSKITLIGNHLTREETVIDVPEWDGGMRYLDSLLSGEIQIIPDAASLPIALRVSVLVEYFGWNITHSKDWSWRSKSVQYDLDLQNQRLVSNATGIATGNLWGSTAIEYWQFENDHYSVTSAHFPDYGRAWATIGVLNASFIKVFEFTSDGGIYEFFVDSFIPGSGYEQLLYRASIADLEGNSDEVVKHTACYSFDGVAPHLVWRFEGRGIFLRHVWHSKRAIVGFDRDKVFFQSYLDGTLRDSLSFEHRLIAPAFFEQGDIDPQLYMLTGADSTVRLYRFDVATAVEEPADPTNLPESFELYQNYPNPFNAGTVIRFDNQKRQRLVLELYNILGQRVVRLLDEERPAGFY